MGVLHSPVGVGSMRYSFIVVFCSVLFLYRAPPPRCVRLMRGRMPSSRSRASARHWSAPWSASSTGRTSSCTSNRHGCCRLQLAASRASSPARADIAHPHHALGVADAVESRGDSWSRAAACNRAGPRRRNRHRRIAPAVHQRGRLCRAHRRLLRDAGGGAVEKRIRRELQAPTTGRANSSALP